MLVDVNVPSSVIEIQYKAFGECERLAKMKLPEGLKTIESEAFFRATELKHFQFPATAETIGTGALAGYEELESVILPPKLEIVPRETFAGCSKLKEVVIPQSVVIVLPCAFRDWSGLTYLNLSRCQKLTSIGRSAFANSSQLKSVLLPRTGLRQIEERTFEWCTSLTHLWIPPTVKHIGIGAFAHCTSLLSVELPERLKHLQLVACIVGEDDVLCGYEALVNLYLPRSETIEVFEDYGFMEEMKLGVAADGYEDLVRKLRGRFSSLPLHRACYFQSYHTLQDNIQSIQNIISNVDAAEACNKVDFLGMSPFHILALSQEPRLALFQELLWAASSSSAAAGDVIARCRDVFGCTAFDYLCKNTHSTRAVDVTKSLLPSVLEPRVSFLGLDRWRHEVTSGLDRVHHADSVSLGIEVASVCQKLAEYERLEALSLLEMSVWRMKVQSENATSSMDARECCRVNCGSSIVVTNVIAFLSDDIDTPTPP